MKPDKESSKSSGKSPKSLSADDRQKAGSETVDGASPSGKALLHNKIWLLVAAVFAFFVGAVLSWRYFSYVHPWWFNNKSHKVNVFPNGLQVFPKGLQPFGTPEDNQSQGKNQQNRTPAQQHPVDYSIAPDLSNVYEFKRYVLSKEAKEMIVKNGFVIVPSGYKEFFKLYEKNSYKQIPSFITTDSVLHSYHLLFDAILRDLEEFVFSSKLKNTSKYLLSESQRLYEEFSKSNRPEWAHAAKQGMAFVSVGLKLLDPKFKAPEPVKDIVDKEVSLILKHKGIAASVYMQAYNNPSSVKPNPFLEDYSQYKVRGHYTQSETLKRYFRAMMWYGRMPFRAKSKSESRAALLLSYALAKNSKDWSDIYDPTSFLVGQSDDLTFYDFDYLAKKIYGKSLSQLSLSEVTGSKFEKFYSALPKLREAKINTMVINLQASKKEEKEQTHGFRLMGQRFVLDGYIFQQLVYKNLSVSSDGKKRMLPTALDLPAVFGSDLALEIVKSSKGKEYMPGLVYGGADFPEYLDRVTKLREYVRKISEKKFYTTAYGGWLYTLKSLLKPSSDKAPKFMRGKAWEYKDLNTFLGSFVELKHDTLLYAKDPLGGLGSGAWGQEVLLDWHGYVEPQIELYNRLLTLTRKLDTILSSRDLWNYQGSRVNLSGETVKVSGSKRHRHLKFLISLVEKLVEISNKELSGKELSEKDYEFIRDYGESLENIWAYAGDLEYGADDEALNKNPAAIVADIAADPNGRVLEIAEGYPYYILAPIYDPAKRRIKLAVGAVYSYYEFLRPFSDLLDDQAWRKILESGKAPKQPEWLKKIVIYDKDVEIKAAPYVFFRPNSEIKKEDEELKTFKEECKNRGWRYVEHYNECEHSDRKGCMTDVPGCLPY